MTYLNFFIIGISLLLVLSKSIILRLHASPELILSYTLPKPDTIHLTLEANTQGYIGLGFGSKMLGTNMILVNKEKGNFIVRDTTCFGYSIPTLNLIQTVLLISASRNSTWSSFTIERKLNTNISEDYIINLFHNTSIIWALGASDTLVRHSNHGSTSIVFQQCDSSCLTCSGPSSSNCLTCNNGKKLNNNQSCVTKCLKYENNASTTTCIKCDSDHELFNGTCVALKCDISCLTCLGGSTYNCTSCEDGKYLSYDNYCLPCNKNCLTCLTDSVSCLTCKPSYSLTNNGNCTIPISSIKTNSKSKDLPNFLSDLTSQIEVTSYFQMFWKFNSNDTITMAFRWKTGGYIALGFGTATNGIDVISAEYEKDSIKVYDRWSFFAGLPPMDTELGGKSNLNFIDSINSDEDGFAIVKFNRALNTGDKYDYVIQQKTESFCFVFSEHKTMSYHGPNLKIFKFDFVEGNNGQALLEDIEKSNLTKAHSLGLLITWTLLTDISLIIVRYFKNIKNYINIHSSLFFVINIFTIIMAFLMIRKNGNNFDDKFQNDKIITAHFFFGVLVLNLILVQHTLGYIMKNSKDSKKIGFIHSKLPELKKMHRFIGYSIYILTKFSVFTGVWIYDDKGFLIGSCIYFGLLLAFRIIIEIVYQKTFSKRIADYTDSLDQRNIFKDLLEELKSQEVPSSKIVEQYPDLQWCLLNNSIYDLREFDHPGGNNIIEQINGREIARYFFGGYSLEHADINPYTHSLFAKKILQKRCVGELFKEKNSILQLIPTQKMSSSWSLVKKEKLSCNVTKFELSSKGFVVKNHINGVNWFGYYFTVSSLNSHNKKIRLYTSVICFSEGNITFRNNLLKFLYKTIGKSNEGDDIILQPPPVISETLPLIIKRYDKPEAFSSFIHYSTEEKFEIEGPYGLGLELNQNSTGNHIIICGGTGILPFLDLLDYLLKKTIYQVLLSSVGEKIAEETNFFKDNYQDNLDFKVSLYAAFQTRKEFEYLDFLIELYNINKKFNLCSFDMILRFNDGAKIQGIPTLENYFDDDFFKTNINNDECSKIYICGDSKMNKIMPEICLRNHIDREKIKIV